MNMPSCDHWIQYKAGKLEINVECQRQAGHKGAHVVDFEILDGFKWSKGMAALRWNSAKRTAKLRT